MTPQWIDHIVFLCLALVFPIWNYFAIRKRAALIEAGREELRMKLYRTILVEEWLMAVGLLAGWFALARGGAALGLVPRAGALAWTGYGLSALIVVGLVVQARSVVRNRERLASLKDTFRKVAFLVPRTREEQRTFVAVSVTAGICEELIYRGYLIAYLMSALGAPFWVAALLSSAVFGLAHSYQGPSGIPRTAAVGGVLALLYGLTGSLWAAMVVHAVLDITSGRIVSAARGANGPDLNRTTSRTPRSLLSPDLPVG